MSEGEKVVGENTLYSRILVSKWDKMVRGGRGGVYIVLS
jgi:hypothetical protein